MENITKEPHVPVEYTPKYIKQDIDTRPGTVLESDRFNELFNLNIIQGDYNSEILAKLIEDYNKYAGSVDGTLGEIDLELLTKLTLDNLLQGKNVTLVRDANGNVTISAEGSVEPEDIKASENITVSVSEGVITISSPDTLTAENIFAGTNMTITKSGKNLTFDAKGSLSPDDLVAGINISLDKTIDGRVTISATEGGKVPMLKEVYDTDNRNEDIFKYVDTNLGQFEINLGQFAKIITDSLELTNSNVVTINDNLVKLEEDLVAGDVQVASATNGLQTYIHASGYTESITLLRTKDAGSPYIIFKPTVNTGPINTIEVSVYGQPTVTCSVRVRGGNSIKFIKDQYYMGIVIGEEIFFQEDPTAAPIDGANFSGLVQSTYTPSNSELCFRNEIVVANGTNPTTLDVPTGTIINVLK